MSLNLSQVFVKYPDVAGAASALRKMLASHAGEGREIPRHLVVQTGTPWLAVLAVGNSAPPEMAEYLSRVLEAHAVWFGLSGRALAYRLRRFHLGRKTAELLTPPELFGKAESFPLPAYADVERVLHDELVKEGLPKSHLFLFAEELGASGRESKPDGVAIASAPWSRDGVDQQDFVQRLPTRHDGPIRTQFDRFDDEKEVVADELVLRGSYDEARAKSLLALMQAMASRRRVPPGWRYVYLLQSSAGPDLLRPIGELYARMKVSEPGFDLAIE